MRDEYEAVIGLEVHAELSTKTKIFCACPSEFGGEPNSRICPVCMGLPGALPVLNRQALRLGVKAGLALSCTVSPLSGQDRKNYFYPDLPKAYQISQFDRPLCRNGHLDIEADGQTKSVGITEIHIEEDAGKLIHDPRLGTCIDYNRCGVPLIEIVSEPDLHTADEAKAYLKKLRTVLRYAQVSDCRMNEGSFRADVNLSVRKKGDPKLGTRTEIKNLNSFAFVGKAIEWEAERQIAVLESGGSVLRQTRRFDPATGQTYPMRSKEEGADYRFFPDPDLPPAYISPEEIEKIAKTIPELPDARKKRWTSDMNLSAQDSDVLCADLSLADYFDRAAQKTRYPKLLAGLILTELLRQNDSENFSCDLSPDRLGAVAELLGDEQINRATAKKLIGMLTACDADPACLVREQNLAQINDRATLLAVVRQVLADNLPSVEDYRNGKKRAAKKLIGGAMAATDGKANPRILQELITDALEDSVKP